MSQFNDWMLILSISVKQPQDRRHGAVDVAQKVWEAVHSCPCSSLTKKVTVGDPLGLGAAEYSTDRMPPPRAPVCKDRIEMTFVVDHNGASDLRIFTGRIKRVFRERAAEGWIAAVVWEDGDRDARRLLVDDLYDDMGREAGWRFRVQPAPGPAPAQQQPRTVAFDVSIPGRSLRAKMRESQRFRKLVDYLSRGRGANAKRLVWRVDGRTIENVDATVLDLGITEGCDVTADEASE